MQDEGCHLVPAGTSVRSGELIDDFLSLSVEDKLSAVRSYMIASVCSGPTVMRSVLMRACAVASR